MRFDLKIVIIIIIIGSAVGLGAIGGYYYSQSRQLASDTPAVLGQRTKVVPRGSENFSELAARLADTLNDVSPTPATADIGWIAQKVSFVIGIPQAYIEYTDTHLALRLLMEYDEQTEGLATRVLATFIPTESGTWEVQYGADTARGKDLQSYRYDPVSQSWRVEGN